MNLKLRIASEPDMEMINDIYRKIDFKESDYSNEKIVMVKSNSAIVGLGRLQKVDSTNSELGGIFVEKDYRGKGIAGKIVSKLVDISTDSEYLYCIPFEHLKKFYKSYGFEDVKGDNNVPEKIRSKFKWCNEHYDKRTLLLVKTNKLKGLL